jgi:hypothetical protein
MKDLRLNLYKNAIWLRYKIYGDKASRQLKHALTLTATMRFSIGIPRGGRLPNDLLFFYSKKKVSKKGRAPNYVLHPII